MDTRQITADYRMAGWTQIIWERNQSGETIRDFCEARDISRDSYYYWQRKLRAAAADNVAHGNAAAPKGWVVCREAESTAASGNCVTVGIGGCRVTVAADTDLGLFSKVCRVLVAL